MFWCWVMLGAASLALGCAALAEPSLVPHRGALLGQHVRLKQILFFAWCVLAAGALWYVASLVAPLERSWTPWANGPLLFIASCLIALFALCMTAVCLGALVTAWRRRRSAVPDQSAQ